MRRGSTPTHFFKSKIDLTDATEIYITYRQGCRTAVEKKLEDIEVTEEGLAVTLSQADTLAFCDKEDVEIQVRVKWPDGKSLPSNIIKRPVGRILKEGII